MDISWDPSAGPVVVLTGAGISAESGIPTFRGPEGYWTRGSEVYHPQELATHAAFLRMPELVWQWYLYRRTVCRRAEPNRAHHALVELEAALGDDFRLITQNVDGLHLRAGSSLERTYQIHGCIDFMRCGRDCCPDTHSIPDAVGDLDRDDELTDQHRQLLVCPACGAGARPHVLWFDEVYDEARFRWESSLEVASRLSLLIIVGSTASTNLPNQVAGLAARRGASIVDINIDDNPFAELAVASGGAALRGPAGELLPQLVASLVDSLR